MANGKRQKKKKSRDGAYAVAYVVVAIIAAIALWSYITLVENPETESPVNNIPIVFVGEESLTNNNLMLVSVNTHDLDLRFTGKWNTVSSLTNSNVSATVDLSTIVSKWSADPGVYQLDYTLNYANGVSPSVVTISGADYDYVTVTVEKTISRSVPIRASYDGTVAPSYTARSLEYSAQTVMVYGPQAKVEEIAYASASFVREEPITGTVVEECDLVLINREGEAIDDDDLRLSLDYVTLTLPVLMVKDIPLSVDVIYGRSNSRENTTVTIDPLTITISGDANLLNGINEINIGTIDTTKAIRGGSQSFGIIIPDGCTNVNNVAMANVRWEVSGLSYVFISVTDIEAASVTEGYEAQFVTKSLDVKLRGTELELNTIKNDPSCISIITEMDEQGAITGEFIVSPVITVEGFSGVDVIGDYEVVVRLAIAPPTPPSPPPDDIGDDGPYDPGNGEEEVGGDTEDDNGGEIDDDGEVHGVDDMIDESSGV